MLETTRGTHRSDSVLEFVSPILDDFLVKSDSSRLHRVMKQALWTIQNLTEQLERADTAISAYKDRIAILEQMATTDELTGLMNRRGFYDAFERDLDRANRDITNGGLLIMIDLDNFKQINDQHGHEAGDDALRLVARTLQSHIRKMDIAARLGGDEFVLLFTNADPVATAERAQILNKTLNRLTLKWEGERIPVRASLGMRHYKKGDSMEKILSQADYQMYANKKGKR